MIDLNEKIEKTIKKREALLEQRKKLDEKIKRTESDIEKYQAILNQKKFDAATDVLKVNGITIDDVISAVSSGDVLKLQQLMENNKRNNNETGKETEGEMKVNES